MVSKRWPALLPVAEEFEGVGFDPVDCGAEEGCGWVRGCVGDFERGAAGVDAGDAVADVGEVQGEAALVGADVERAACAAERLGAVGGGGVVEALVEEGAGLLAGGGVEGEAEAVDGEGGLEAGARLRGCGTRGSGRRGCRAASSSRMRGSGRSTSGVRPRASAERISARAARTSSWAVPWVRSCRMSEVVVAVGDDAGEAVGFGEDEAAGVGGGAALGSGAGGEPIGLGDEVATEAECGLEAGAQVGEVGGAGERRAGGRPGGGRSARRSE